MTVDVDIGPSGNGHEPSVERHRTRDEPLDRAGSRAGPPESSEDAFVTRVSSVVQSKCVACHVEAASAADTRLVFVNATDEGHLETNRVAFERHLSEVDDRPSAILERSGVLTMKAAHRFRRRPTTTRRWRVFWICSSGRRTAFRGAWRRGLVLRRSGSWRWIPGRCGKMWKAPRRTREHSRIQI